MPILIGVSLVATLLALQCRGQYLYPKDEVAPSAFNNGGTGEIGLALRAILTEEARRKEMEMGLIAPRVVSSAVVAEDVMPQGFERVQWKRRKRAVVEPDIEERRTLEIIQTVQGNKPVRTVEAANREIKLKGRRKRRKLSHERTRRDRRSLDYQEHKMEVPISMGASADEQLYQFFTEYFGQDPTSLSYIAPSSSFRDKRSLTKDCQSFCLGLENEEQCHDLCLGWTRERQERNTDRRDSKTENTQRRRRSIVEKDRGVDELKNDFPSSDRAGTITADPQPYGSQPQLQPNPTGRYAPLMQQNVGPPPRHMVTKSVVPPGFDPTDPNNRLTHDDIKDVTRKSDLGQILNWLEQLSQGREHDVTAALLVAKKKSHQKHSSSQYDQMAHYDKTHVVSNAVSQNSNYAKPGYSANAAAQSYNSYNKPAAVNYPARQPISYGVNKPMSYGGPDKLAYNFPPPAKIRSAAAEDKPANSSREDDTLTLKDLEDWKKAKGAADKKHNRRDGDRNNNEENKAAPVVPLSTLPPPASSPPPSSTSKSFRPSPPVTTVAPQPRSTDGMTTTLRPATSPSSPPPRPPPPPPPTKQHHPNDLNDLVDAMAKPPPSPPPPGPPGSPQMPGNRMANGHRNSEERDGEDVEKVNELTRTHTKQHEHRKKDHMHKHHENGKHHNRGHHGKGRKKKKKGDAKKKEPNAKDSGFGNGSVVDERV